MLKDVQDITRVFDLLYTACENIRDDGQCGDCPIKLYCLDGQYGGATVTETAEEITVGMWEDFLTYADESVPSKEVQADIDYAIMADRDRD